MWLFYVFSVDFRKGAAVEGRMFLLLQSYQLNYQKIHIPCQAHIQ